MSPSNTAFRTTIAPQAIAAALALAVMACILAPPLAAVAAAAAAPTAATTAAAPAAAAAGAAAAAPVAGHAPYLIFHMDGVGSSTFFELYDSGALPNIAELFSRGAVIRHAISPFRPGTEMLYSRLKTGSDASSAAHPAAWRTISRTTGEWRAYSQNLWGLWKWAPPYAVTQALNGVPGLWDIAGLSALNIERILRDHSVVEFLWFGTDTLGHYRGIEQQKAGAVRFDAYLRPVADYVRDHPGSLNLVLYADHGMSEIEQSVSIEQAMADAPGEGAVLAVYPNVYLREPQQARSVAYALGNNPGIDWAFFREGDGKIAGYCAGGSVTLDYGEDGIAYSWQGVDMFEYEDTGHAGERLSGAEWLELTATRKYPAAPAQIVRYMANEFSGDVVVVVNAPKGADNGNETGVHQGIIDQDCTVPVLLAGPDIKADLLPEAIYLHGLYTEVLGIDAINTRMNVRERNSVLVATDEARVRLSPSPSLCLTAEVRLGAGAGDGLFLWETCVFRSYNARLWIGAGLSFGALNAAASLRAELFVGDLVIERWSLARPDVGAEQRLKAEYQSENGFALFWEFPARLGMGFAW